MYEHRKSTVAIKVTNKDGSPAVGAKIRAKQKTHEFLFGSNLFDAVAGYTPHEPEFIREKIGIMAELNNFATLPFYWGRFEKEENNPDTNGRMKAAKYLKGLGLTVKGHPLCWHTSCAEWLLKYDDETILKKQLERIQREVSDFRGVINMWDVINEVVIMPIFDKYDNAVTRICNRYGQIPLVKAVFTAAREANPNATLVLNDFNVSPAYAELIERVLDAGTPIDVIGIQSHQHQGYWGKEKTLEVLERFKVFGLPLHFTENTIISGELMPPHIEDLNDWKVEAWPTTPEGEARQAKEVVEMYETLFADPAVEAITTWDAADNAWLHAPAGLLRVDNSRKPVYDELFSRIRREWLTDTTLVTDEAGVASLTGFRGEYEIDGERFTLSKETAKSLFQLQRS
ncbi:beta-xylanase [Clostridia bacterium]|nr:beta-xylanase [Clostridia bacterium]